MFDPKVDRRFNGSKKRSTSLDHEQKRSSRVSGERYSSRLDPDSIQVRSTTVCGED